MYGLQEALSGETGDLKEGIECLEEAAKSINEAAARMFRDREGNALRQIASSILAIKTGVADGKVRVSDMDPEQRKELRRVAASLLGGTISEKKRAVLAKARQKKAEIRAQKEEDIRLRKNRGY